MNAGCDPLVFVWGITGMYMIATLATAFFFYHAVRMTIMSKGLWKDIITTLFLGACLVGMIQGVMFFFDKLTLN